MRERIAVIGTGTMGSQALWQLSRTVCDITGYEIHSPGHAHGAAGGETRLFRTLELEEPRYLPLVERADELWRSLEASSGRSLRDVTGALIIGDVSCSAIHTALGALDDRDSRYRVRTRQETRQVFPEFALDDNDITIWDERGGIIKPELSVHTAAGLAEANGARIIRDARVRAIEQTDSGRVSVRTESDEKHYDRVIIAAGAWTSQLLPDLSSLFAMRRLVNIWFFGKGPGDLESILPYIRAEPAYSYGLPVPDRTMMKIGLGFRNHLPVDSPDNAPLRVDREDLAPFVRHLRRYIPVVDEHPVRVGVYFESYTKNRREFVQEHPAMDNVLVMAGFSGHGFKMSPAMGEVAANWATGQQQCVDMTFLRRTTSNLPHAETTEA